MNRHLAINASPCSAVLCPSMLSGTSQGINKYMNQEPINRLFSLISLTRCCCRPLSSHSGHLRGGRKWLTVCRAKWMRCPVLQERLQPYENTALGCVAKLHSHAILEPSVSPQPEVAEWIWHSTSKIPVATFQKLSSHLTFLNTSVPVCKREMIPIPEEVVYEVVKYTRGLPFIKLKGGGRRSESQPSPATLLSRS